MSEDKMKKDTSKNPEDNSQDDDKKNEDNPQDKNLEGKVLDEEEEKIDRTPRVVPYAKFAEDRKKFQKKITDLEEQVTKLSSKAPSGEEVDDEEIKNLAYEFNVTEEVVNKLLKIAQSKNKLPSDVVERIERASKTAEERYQDDRFEQDIYKLSEINPEVLNPEVKARLKELAFTEELAKVPLKVIYLGYPEEFKEARKTAETSRGGSQISSGLSFGDIMLLSGDEKGKIIKEMNKETYDKFSEWLKKQS